MFETFIKSLTEQELEVLRKNIERSKGQLNERIVNIDKLKGNC